MKSRPVGIDVGGTKVLAVALGDSGEVVAEHRASTPHGGDALVEAIVTAVSGLGVPASSLGVGIPGLVDRAGVLRVGPNLPGVIDLDAASVLRERLEVAVVVDNDANCATWAEVHVGAAQGARDVVLVTLGTGIGGGVVAGGVLQRGAHGFAGEPGHMVVHPDGPPCPCGRRGCWERYASGSGLARLGAVERGEQVTEAAAEGDADALEVLRTFGWWTALGIANLVALYDPEVVVVGGGLVDAGDLVLQPVRDAFAGLVLAAGHRPPVPIVAAALGEHAGAIGAALLGSGG